MDHFSAAAMIAETEEGILDDQSETYTGESTQREFSSPNDHLHFLKTQSDLCNRLYLNVAFGIPLVRSDSKNEGR